MRGVSALLLCVAVAHAALVVELRKREIPADEQHQLLELLQLEAGPESEVPNVKLNSNFFGTLKIGEAKQEFEVVFDTGSDALWVYSDKCSSCEAAQKHTFHRDHQYHQRNNEFSIKYGTGESHGSTGTERMVLGDLEVQDQVFGQCDQPDEVMKGFPFDGIVGLSRPMFMDPNGLVPIMETVKKEKLLEERKMANTFSFYLGRDEGDASHLIFGGSHHMLHEGAIHYVPALSKNIFWELPLDDILIHHKTGPTEHIATNERTLERQFGPVAHQQVIHDHFAEIMADPTSANAASTHRAPRPQPQAATHPKKAHATQRVDPYATAPLAEALDVRAPTQTKKQRGTARPAGDYFGAPMQSADGYQFVTDAEPILLELESMLTSKPVHRSKPVRAKRHRNDLEEEGVLEDILHVIHAPTASEGETVADAEGADSAVDPFDMHAPPPASTATRKPATPATTATARQAPVASHAKAREEAAKVHAESLKKAHKKSMATTAKRSAPVPAQAERGSGELLSDFPVTPGVSIKPCMQDSTHPCVVSMDSGHSLISGPPELVRRLKQQTMPPGACTEEATASMPDVSFVIGGKLFTLTPMDYLIELEGQCTPAFRERAFRNGHDWVLGEHFMRTFYPVFDYDDMRVGLARVDNIKGHLETILAR